MDRFPTTSPPSWRRCWRRDRPRRRRPSSPKPRGLTTRALAPFWNPSRRAWRGRRGPSPRVSSSGCWELRVEQDLSLTAQFPVVRPGHPCPHHQPRRLAAPLAGRAHRAALGPGPPIESAGDRQLDQLPPLLVILTGAARWEAEELPAASRRQPRDPGRACRASRVRARLGASRIGCHQALLDREHQVLGRSHGPRPRGVSLSKPQLERANRRGQRGRHGPLLHEPELLNPLEQPVGLGQQPSAVKLGLREVGFQQQRGHAWQRSARRPACKPLLYKPSRRAPLPKSTFSSTGAGISSCASSSRHRWGWMNG